MTETPRTPSSPLGARSLCNCGDDLAHGEELGEEVRQVSTCRGPWCR